MKIKKNILIIINVVVIALLIFYIYYKDEKLSDNIFPLLALILTLVNTFINYKNLFE